MTLPFINLVEDGVRNSLLQIAIPFLPVHITSSQLWLEGLTSKSKLF
jgi:hypothetical protein